MSMTYNGEKSISLSKASMLRENVGVAVVPAWLSAAVGISCGVASMWHGEMAGNGQWPMA
jgi:hypothetical protein